MFRFPNCAVLLVLLAACDTKADSGAGTDRLWEDAAPALPTVTINTNAKTETLKSPDEVVAATQVAEPEIDRR